ncbi:MAG: hypothetical protein MUE84_15535 [Hyphomonas sp.]|jgi:hypothetical protein|nr:hypothetical protein [Hyphomonas sp.]
MDIATIQDIPGGAHVWRRALSDLQAGCPGPLADLMRKHPTPAWVALALADFIEAAPKKRGMGRARYSPAGKAAAVAEWLRVQSTLDEAESDIAAVIESIRQDGVPEPEPFDVRRRINALKSQWKMVIAEKHGIAVGTLERAASESKPRRKG